MTRHEHQSNAAAWKNLQLYIYR